MRPVHLLAFLALAGCTPVITHIAPETRVSGLDFREHTREGFLFSPNAYTGEYESVGIVTVTMFSEGKRQEFVNAFGFKEIGMVYQPVALQDLLTESRKRAVALGANALMNLQVRDVKKFVGIGTQDAPGFEVSGFAIKRASTK